MRSVICSPLLQRFQNVEFGIRAGAFRASKSFCACAGRDKITRHNEVDTIKAWYALPTYTTRLPRRK